MAVSISTLSPGATESAAEIQNVKACPEWSAIMDLYRAAAQAYSDGLSGIRYPGDPRFSDAWQRTESARKACDFYRSELMSHEHTHACGGRAPMAKTA